MPDKEAARTRAKAAYWADPESAKAKRKVHYYANRERILARSNKTSTEQRRLLRLQAFQALGGRCARCGFDDVRALQIDHVNGD